MKKVLINQLVENFKTMLNPQSKFYKEDLANFKEKVSTLSVNELKERVGRMNAMNDENSEFNRAVRRETKRMEAAGMFDVGKMKQDNAID